MTDKLKEIIENAPIKKKGKFVALMFISNGEYNGFWGFNGYDSMLVLGQEDNRSEGTWYKVATTADVFQAVKLESVSIDIPSDLGVPVMFFHEPIEIDNCLDLSSILVFPKGGLNLPLME